MLMFINKGNPGLISVQIYMSSLIEIRPWKLIKTSSNLCKSPQSDLVLILCALSVYLENEESLAVARACMNPSQTKESSFLIKMWEVAGALHTDLLLI